jgi:8-oxo-dGTP diphosphatase
LIYNDYVDKNQIKQPVLKAGGIVVNSKNEVLLLYRASINGRSFDDRTFPKGHIEVGETPEETATREIFEETGLSLKIEKELPISNYTNKDEGDIKTYMYLIRCEDDTDLKNEYEGNKLLWVPIDKVVDKLSFDNLKEYFRKIKI